jgi:hypothetical protein
VDMQSFVQVALSAFPDGHKERRLWEVQIGAQHLIHIDSAEQIVSVSAQFCLWAVMHKKREGDSKGSFAMVVKSLERTYPIACRRRGR